MIYITRHLLAITPLLASLLFIACFDIPSKPNTKNTLKSVTIQVSQSNKVDTLLLKIHPNDSAILSAIVHPKAFEKKLKFNWFHQTNNQSKKSLGEGQNYTIPAGASLQDLPNLLVITDEEGNSLTNDFDIIVNTPPKILTNTQPAKGDTLYGSEFMAFEFAWVTFDNDNEDLKNTIIIDNIHYEVGNLTFIHQSGFAPGKHTFQIFVSDEYGDMDSTSVIQFYVKNSEKGNP